MTQDLMLRPFSKVPNPVFLYMGDQYKTAFDHLVETATEGLGLTILSGPVGSGKTTLVRAALDYLQDYFEERLTTCVIYNPNYPTDVALLKGICADFGLDSQKPKAELMLVLEGFLVEQYKAGKTVLLVIDEAHRLNGKQMELVRQLFNFSTQDTFLVNVILAGEEKGLSARLAQKEAIVSRAEYWDKLKPLSATDTEALIRHRLEVAQMDPGAFDARTIVEIYEQAKGLPREIVKLARERMKEMAK